MPFGLSTKRSASQDDDNWHRNVDATAGTAQPTDVDFPWTHLQKHTEIYLKKKGKLTPEQLDERLLVLIEKHTAKEVAIAACAHAISSQNVRRLLTVDLYVDPGIYFGLASYLQAIVAAHHVKPEAASQSEASWAGELIAQSVSTVSEQTLGEQLWRILTHFTNGVTADSLLRNHITTLARTVCQDFAALLETLRLENRWIDAHEAAGWLSAISAKSLNPSNAFFGPVQLLDSHFSTWRAWVAWRPNLKRLRYLEEAAINRRDPLRDLLALDGPDFTSNGQATLGDGLISQDSGLTPNALHWENIHIELKGGITNEARDIIDRLSSAIDAACSGSREFTALLAHLCVGKAISHEVLQILEGVYFIAEPLITVVLNLYTRPHQESATQIAGIRQLLFALNNIRTHKLRESLAPYLVYSVTNYINQSQSRLRAQLEAARPWDGTERDLLIFGKQFQNAPWILPVLDTSLRNYINFIINGPSLDVMEILQALRINTQGASPLTATPLSSQIDAYCKAWLIPNCWIDDQSIILVNSLLNLWQRCPDGKRRDLALQIAQYPVPDPQLRCQRLAQIVALPEELVAAILTVLKGCTERLDTSFVNIVGFLASEPRTEIVGCWRMLLYREFEKRGEQFVDQALKTLSAETWLKWLHDIRSIFPDKMEWFSPSLLNPDLHAWSQRLTGYLPTLTRLEQAIGHGAWIQCLLKGPRSPDSDNLAQILRLMKETQGIQRQRVMEVIVARLNSSGCNSGEIEEDLLIVSKTNPEGAEACDRLLEICRQCSPQFAEVLTGVLLQNPELEELDRSALKSLAGHCGLHLDANGDAAAESFEVAADDLDGRFEELLAETQRLENLRLSLMAVDPNGVSRLLSILKIEASSPFDDMLASLPSALTDVVERVADNEVELQFPITNLTKLQQLAIAVGDSQSFLVRLKFDQRNLPSEFCVHLSNDSKGLSNTHEHTPWILSKGRYPPVKQYCYGRPNRGAYQLSCILWRHLRNGFLSLEKTHAFIVSHLADLARSCVVCGGGQVVLRRSTFCQNPTCKTVFWGVSCEILLQEIWHDPTVVDLLLTMAHATALSGKMDLLPGCPTTNPTTVINMLARLPTIVELQRHLTSDISIYKVDFDSSRSLTSYSSELANMLIWACNSYRGFLTAATGQFRIPSFGVHQFLLANASPDLEKAFGAHARAAQTTFNVLFHGTSLDRLYAILCQGLRVCSGTPLQRHGAAQGSGIYMADEPSFSWNYATTVSGSSSGWKNSCFHNPRVMLGCELAGAKPGGDNGTHVIKDPTRLIVRYIFIMAPNASMPRAQDVRPAMQSVFSSLRSGTA